MAGDASAIEQPEQARVRLIRTRRDRPLETVEGYRIIEPPNDRNLESIGTPREDRPQIFIDDEVYRQTTTHLAGDLRYERGGFLLGYRNRTPQGRIYAEVTGFFPATHGSATEVEFQLPPDDWAAAHAERDRRGKGELMIGWVHSHPHHQPAPSEHRDFSIMQGYMIEPEHVTLIVNPNTNQVGVFRWEDGRSVNQGGFILYGDLPNHGLDRSPVVVRTNSLRETEAPRVKVHPETKRPRVKVHPETFWQRVRNWVRTLTNTH